MVSLIVQDIEVLLLVLIGIAPKQIGVGVARRAGPAGFDDSAVRVTVARLIVDDILVVNAKLRRVRFPNLRNVVTERREVLLRKQALARTELKTAGIINRGHFASPAGHRRDLANLVAGREASEWNIQGRPADLVRTLEHVGEVDVGVPKHKFVGECWTEDVCQAC